MAPEGVPHLTPADLEVLRDVDADARRRRWSRATRRRAVAAWLGADTRADTVLDLVESADDPDGAGTPDAGAPGIAPEQVASAVAAVVTYALEHPDTPLVADPAERGPELAQLPLAERPPAQLSVRQLALALARRAARRGKAQA